VLLKPEQLAALRAIEQRSGTSMGGLIRLAVDEWLAVKDGGSRKAARSRGVKRAKRA
jgi:hypothetical protein